MISGAYDGHMSAAVVLPATVERNLTFVSVTMAYGRLTHRYSPPIRR